MRALSASSATTTSPSDWSTENDIEATLLGTSPGRAPVALDRSHGRGPHAEALAVAFDPADAGDLAGERVTAGDAEDAVDGRRRRRVGGVPGQPRAYGAARHGRGRRGERLRIGGV